jgi:hypothetical protein
MTTRKFYLDKADACLAAVDRTRDPAERAALNQIARSYMRLVPLSHKPESVGRM